MSAISVYKRLRAAGVDEVTALLCAEAFDAELKIALDAVLEPRRAKDRERKRVPRNSAESTESVEIQPAKDVSPTPPSENNPSLPKGPLKGPQKVSVPSSEKPKAAVTKPLSWWVGEIWSITPAPGRRRSGKRSLETALGAAIRRGEAPEAIKAGLEAYYASPDATEQGGKFAQGVHVAINSGRWAAFAEAETGPDPPDADPWPRRLLNWRLNAYWNSEWGPKPGKPGYEGPSIESQAA